MRAEMQPAALDQGRHRGDEESNSAVVGKLNPFGSRHGPRTR